MAERPEDPVLKSARREAIAAIVVFALALIVTLTLSYVLGYRHPRVTPSFILGFPEWVFWGVMLPWAAMIVLGFWFAGRFMKDENLGDE